MALDDTKIKDQIEGSATAALYKLIMPGVITAGLALLGWNGVRIINAIDAHSDKLSSIEATMHASADYLRDMTEQRNRELTAFRESIKDHEDRIRSLENRGR